MPVLRVKTTWSGAGAVGGGLTTSYHFVATANAASAQAAVDAMRDFWTTLNPGISNAMAWGVQGIVAVWNAAVQEITSELSVITRTGAGSSTGSLLPPATQGLVTWRTTTFLNGRRLQGHWFIPGPTEEESSNSGAPIAAYLTRLNGAIATLQGISDPNLGVNSRRNNLFVSPVTGSAGTKWAVLRSRRD